MEKIQEEQNMKLYLIRHGETDYNKMKRNQGQIDIPLNEYGRELAEKTREGLAEVPFDLCLCAVRCPEPERQQRLSWKEEIYRSLLTNV